ncbi:MAG: hypothetical protein JWP97_4952 [Labilithrix sp.]|nr:hypothetical protein [Labilithrix sp.]
MSRGPALLGRALALSFAATLVACGSPAPDAEAPVGVTPRKAVPVDATWPAVATGEDVAAATTVEVALRAPEGARVAVRAVLVALPAPCPTCNVGADRGAGTAVDARIGSTSRPRGRHDLPGCAPCPAAVVTFAEAAPGEGTPSPPLATTGASEALQPRHVGRSFVLTGIVAGEGDDRVLRVSNVHVIADR